MKRNPCDGKGNDISKAKSQKEIKLLKNDKFKPVIGWLIGVPKTQARPHHGPYAFRGSYSGLPL